MSQCGREPLKAVDAGRWQQVGGHPATVCHHQLPGPSDVLSDPGTEGQMWVDRPVLPGFLSQSLL